jgi:hypothetical protein
MGRKKSNRTKEEWAEYHAARQREYYHNHRNKIAQRKLELYYENKERRASDEEV